MLDFKNSVFADEDIIESLGYTFDKWGYEQMKKYEDILEKGRDRIRKDPYLPTSKRQERLGKGCRSYRVESHYFFYRINEEESTVEIARILHESRDFPRHVSRSHFPE